MELITARTRIRSVASRWYNQYKDAINRKLGDSPIKFREVYEALQKLDLETATPDDLEKIIGNRSWSTPLSCDECGCYKNAVIRLGEEPDYDSHTVYICMDCLEKAVKTFTEEGKNEN